MDDYDNDAQWQAARAKSRAVNGYIRAGIKSKSEGFFKRTRKQMSQVLPTFNYNDLSSGDNWRNREKLGRGRLADDRGGGIMSNFRSFCRNVFRRFRSLILLLLGITLLAVLIAQTHPRTRYRASTHLGGGSKFVIVLAANEGGGVMDWKGPRQWAIERDSVRNKRKYAEQWGYHLEIADLSTKKRYAHEWRESWEKIDILRNCMAKYPQAEWFWWLDLNTLIMEPSISLQSHIFNSLSTTTYRDLNHYNPINITHPPSSPLLDPISRSATGDNLTSSISLILAQDCGGFNLGSFFIRRGKFADRLLDIWWDPVLYEQRHMQWEHKEQDALEHVYTSQPWVRTHTAFVEQRMINSFPPAACAQHDEKGELVRHRRFHYGGESGKARDFLVNMAGCEWGRDCWNEMFEYRELSKKLNRNVIRKGWDWFISKFGVSGKTVEDEEDEAEAKKVNSQKKGP